MENKWFLKSKTVYGVIIAMLPNIVALLSTVGVPVSEDVMGMFQETGEIMFNAVGALLAVYGRVNADTNLTLER
ncbi:MAG: hypothetical protein V3R25_05775 [Nitrosomonadaceae bacterium]